MNHSAPIDRSATKCGLCGELAAHAATQRCDRCWELEKRIKADPALARRILALVDDGGGPS